MARAPDVTPFSAEVVPGTVRVSGEVDLATAPALRAAIGRLLDTGTRSASIDLAGVTFLDSSGLHALVDGERACRAAGVPMVLSGTPTAVLRVLELAGLDGFFELRGAPGRRCRTRLTPDGVPRPSAG
jgi:anti-sigma B factor antagonist